MRYTLKNDILTIEVDTLGAELKSLKKNGKEYMWQALPEYWKRTSPVLFPIIGSLKNSSYTINDISYSLSQHGFARDMEFSLVEKETNHLTFRLQDNSETLKKFPYRFILDITYQLDGNKLDVIWNITNLNKTLMSFSIGAHPAFNIKDGYKYQFDTSSFKYRNLDSNGLIIEKLNQKELIDNILQINQDLFKDGALVINSKAFNNIDILDEDNNKVIGVNFSTPFVGIWAPIKNDIPFVCIEPWYGHADYVSFNGSWDDRPDQLHIRPKTNLIKKYAIIIY